jgi:hypothetical protein
MTQNILLRRKERIRGFNIPEWQLKMKNEIDRTGGAVFDRTGGAV